MTVSDQTFRWKTDASDGVLTLRFEGELDIAMVPRCESELPQWIDHRASIVELDLSGLGFVDSSALRFLVDMKRATEITGKRMFVRDPSPPVLRLFEMAGLTTWFDYVEGHGPTFVTCPLCGGEVIEASPRCSHCGGAL